MASELGRPARLARTLIKNYGLDRFMRILELLGKGISGELIAQEFEVTRQRVHQWRQLLGKTTKLYAVDAGVLDLVKTLIKP